QCCSAAGVVVASAEEPRLARRGDGLKGAFGGVVRQHQASIVEEPLQGVTVIVCVLEGAAHEPSLVFELGSLLLDPREEREHVRAEVGFTQLLNLRWRLLLPRLVEFEDPPDPHQPFASDSVLRNGGLPEATTRVVPTAYFDAAAAVMLDVVLRSVDLGRVGKEQIEDAFGVGLHIAAEASEAGVDGTAGFPLEVIVEDVVSVG